MMVKSLQQSEGEGRRATKNRKCLFVAPEGCKCSENWLLYSAWHLMLKLQQLMTTARSSLTQVLYNPNRTKWNYNYAENIREFSENNFLQDKHHEN